MCEPQKEISNGKLASSFQMSSLTTIINPISQDKYWIFYNDANDNLGVAQQYKSELGEPVSTPGEQASSDVPAGSIANPSSMTCVQFQSQVNVYGVLNGNTKGDLLICRLSPGFQLLNTLNPPPTNSSSIAACSDSDNNGTLFYLTQDSDGDNVIYGITLPGTQQAPTTTGTVVNLNPTTHLGAAYGTLGNVVADSYVGMQAKNNELVMSARASQLQGTITNTKGMKNTPIAMTFVGNTLVVYFFGIVGSGTDPNSSPVIRATTQDLKSFRTTNLTNAPSPNGYTQLAAIANGSPKNNGLGTVILTYVQAASNQLVSWEDDLSKFSPQFE